MLTYLHMYIVSTNTGFLKDPLYNAVTAPDSGVSGAACPLPTNPPTTAPAVSTSCKYLGPRLLGLSSTRAGGLLVVSGPGAKCLPIKGLPPFGRCRFAGALATVQSYGQIFQNFVRLLVPQKNSADFFLGVSTLNPELL